MIFFLATAAECFIEVYIIEALAILRDEVDQMAGCYTGPEPDTEPLTTWKGLK